MSFTDESRGLSITYGTFMGLMLGLNFGAALGLLYGGYKARQLKLQHPDIAEDISRYVEIQKSITARNMRVGNVPD